MDDPPDGGIRRAQSLLEDLAAVSADGRLTELGHRMADLGFHPRMGAIAVHGQDHGQAQLAAEVVAVLDTGGIGGSEVAEAVRDLRAAAVRRL